LTNNGSLPGINDVARDTSLPPLGPTG